MLARNPLGEEPAGALPPCVLHKLAALFPLWHVPAKASEVTNSVCYSSWFFSGCRAVRERQGQRWLDAEAPCFLPLQHCWSDWGGGAGIAVKPVLVVLPR